MCSVYGALALECETCICMYTRGKHCQRRHHSSTVHSAGRISMEPSSMHGLHADTMEIRIAHRRRGADIARHLGVRTLRDAGLGLLFCHSLLAPPIHRHACMCMHVLGWGPPTCMARWKCNVWNGSMMCRRHAYACHGSSSTARTLYIYT